MDNLKQLLLQELMSDETIEIWDPHEHKYFGASTRTLSFFGDVNYDRSRLLISQLLHLEELDDVEPIKIFLNTEGGSLTDGLAIYDAITNLSCPVIVIATGICASAGLLILTAADYKMATSNTVFYYHQPVISDSRVCSRQEIESLSEHYLYCQSTTDEIIRKKNRITKAVWNKKFLNKTSFYFNAEKALEFRLINDIMESRKVKFSIAKD